MKIVNFITHSKIESALGGKKDYITVRILPEDFERFRISFPWSGMRPTDNAVLMFSLNKDLVDYKYNGKSQTLPKRVKQGAFVGLIDKAREWTFQTIFVQSLKQARGLGSNPPFYAHNLYEKKTHGLNLKQMRRLYAMVSRGNQRAITYARNVLGIPFSESPSQVKAVVLHHVRDLAERKLGKMSFKKNEEYAERWLKRRLRGNPGVPGMFTPTGGVLEIKQTGYYDSDFEGKAQLLKKGEIVNIVATTYEKRGGKIHNYWVVKTADGKKALIPVEFGSMISWARVRRNPASSDVTAVVFRTFRSGGEVIALFPYEPGTNDPWTMMSYQHIGQHGPADMGLTSVHTRPSTPDEIRPLKNELERIGYKLKILKRIPGDAVRVRAEKLRSIR